MSLNVILLRQSFELVVERAPNLTHRFYEILFERYPETREMFPTARRGQQENMLTQALVAVMDHLEDAPWLTSTLHGLGARHVHYGVSDEMYAWVGDALLSAIAEAAGADWTPELRRAWTDAYGAIAGLMQEGARLAEQSPPSLRSRRQADAAPPSA
jgi:hemoglobin-like flavoprotein